LIYFDQLAQSEELTALREVVAPDCDPVTAIIKDEELCIRCGLCADRCPNAAITMERFCFGGVAR
jgi:ferredoxin